jgi:hypothetical protein
MLPKSIFRCSEYYKKQRVKSLSGDNKNLEKEKRLLR